MRFEQANRLRTENSCYRAITTNYERRNKDIYIIIMKEKRKNIQKERKVCGLKECEIKMRVVHHLNQVSPELDRFGGRLIYRDQ